jgi:hypothetical protein
MDVWFCIEQEQSPRGKNRERKNLKKLFTRFSKARQESFFLLTKTYHGCPVTRFTRSWRGESAQIHNAELRVRTMKARLFHGQFPGGSFDSFQPVSAPLYCKQL